MTMVDPTNPLSTAYPTVNTQWFPGRVRPYNNIQPMTYRDGETYLDVQEALRSWLQDQLVPFVNATFEEYVLAFNEALAKLTGYAAEFQTYIETQKGIFDAKKDEYVALVAKSTSDFIDLSTAAITTVQEGATAAEASRVAAEAARDLAEQWAGQSKADQDVNVSELVKDRTTQTYAAFARRLGVFVDDFGAKGDNVTDDTLAIQAALDAIATVGAGKLYFSPGKIYRYTDTLVTPAFDVIWEGEGATLVKNYTGTQSSTSVVNRVNENEIGYGASGRNLRFRNIRFLGNYGAAGILDFSMAFHHVDGISFDNVTWEQGNVHAHYVDLAGCRFVEFNSFCRMIGANPPTGREYVEAIQIDQSTYAGAGWKNWPRSSFDGLPTKNVTVDGMSFTDLKIGNNSYPCPNPIGSHGAALLGDAGYYEDIKFINNRVEGWTRIIAIGAGAAYGWVHFRGVRNLTISNNTFKYTGLTGLAAISAVVNAVATTQAVADADVTADAPVSQTLATPRRCVNVTINDNKFIGFKNGPTSDDYGLITLNSPVSTVLSNNTSDGANSSVVKVSSSGTADGPVITGNHFYSDSDKPVLALVASTIGITAGNTIRMSNTNGIGISLNGCNGDRVSDNAIRGGNIGVKAAGTTNTDIDGNTIVSQTGSAILVGHGSDTADAFDTIVKNNRSRSTEAGAVGVNIGTHGNRTRLSANFWSTTAKMLDSGTSTVTTAYADNT